MTRARESPSSQVRRRSRLRRGLRCVGTRARTRGGRSKYPALSAELPPAARRCGDAGFTRKVVISIREPRHRRVGRGFYEPTETPQLRDTVPDPRKNPADETTHSGILITPVKGTEATSRPPGPRNQKPPPAAADPAGKTRGAPGALRGARRVREGACGKRTAATPNRARRPTSPSTASGPSLPCPHSAKPGSCRFPE
jgi:hypothetical protein